MTYKRNCSNDDMFESMMIFICCYVVIRILVLCVVCVDEKRNGLRTKIFYFEFFHTCMLQTKKFDSSFLSL